MGRRTAHCLVLSARSRITKQACHCRRTGNILTLQRNSAINTIGEAKYIYMVTKAIAAKLVAKPGKEAEVEALLTSALALANQEPLTVTWYAVKFNENTFGIFDTFAADEGRDAHLNGQIAAALMAKSGELLAEPPQIDKVDVLAAKEPTGTGGRSTTA